MSNVNKEVINICMLSSYYLPHYSGPSKQAHQVNKRLTKKNVNITVITQNMDEISEVIENIEVVRLPKRGFKSLFQNKISTLLWAILASLYLLKNRKSIDVVHVLDSYFPSALFTIACLIINKPILVKSSIARGAFNNTKIHQKIRINLLRKKANMIAISKETHQELIDNLFEERNIYFIPNGVDTSLFSSTSNQKKTDYRNKLGIQESKLVASYVGLINKRKGTDILLMAWKSVIEKYPNALLLLIGPSEKDKFFEEVKKYIYEEKLEKNVLILGEKDKDEIYQYLSISEVFVFPSEREGLPNALLEAMSVGLPCIARNIGGVSDLIQHNTNGLLCYQEEVNNLVNELSQNIKIIFENEQRSILLSKNAREFIVNSFSIDLIAEKYNKLYRDLLKTNKPYI